MIIEVKVHPKSKQNKIVWRNTLKVYLTEPPENNKANTQMLDLLKKTFKKEVSLIRGHNSRKKIISIELSEGELNEIREKYGNS
jgi:uncharacterized protein (TIGR00251 family)